MQRSQGRDGLGVWRQRKRTEAREIREAGAGTMLLEMWIGMGSVRLFQLQCRSLDFTLSEEGNLWKVLTGK